MGQSNTGEVLPIAGFPAVKDRIYLFVREYIKDYNPARAAERAGYASPSKGNELLQRRDVQDAVSWLLQDFKADAQINAEWVLWEAVDNHVLARQAGNLSASNKALELVGRLASVDAFAAAKVDINLGQDVAERLNRGRERARLVSGEDSASAPESFTDGDTGAWAHVGTGSDGSSSQRPVSASQGVSFK